MLHDGPANRLVTARAADDCLLYAVTKTGLKRAVVGFESGTSTAASYVSILFPSYSCNLAAWNSTQCCLLQAPFLYPSGLLRILHVVAIQLSPLFCRVGRAHTRRPCDVWTLDVRHERL